MYALWSRKNDQNESCIVEFTPRVKVLYFSPTRIPLSFSIHESTISPEPQSSYIERMSSLAEELDWNSHMPSIYKERRYRNKHHVNLDLMPYYNLISIIHLKQIFRKVLEKHYQNFDSNKVYEELPNIYDSLREIVNFKIICLSNLGAPKSISDY